MRPRLYEFLRFCIVGLLGYFVDAGALELLVYGGLLNWEARIISILIALQCTYAMHGLFTYRGHGGFSSRTWFHFMFCNLLGAAINYAVFLIALEYIHLSHALAERQIALFFGMAVALWFNYWANRRFVFRTPDQS